ncbi:MAG: hypothetical protein ACK55I_12030, partial [bacterium]
VRGVCDGCGKNVMSNDDGRWREDDKYYHVLGGNQSNSVSVTRIIKTRLYKARRTAWKVAQPSNVRKVILEAKGTITTNEA